MGTLACPSSTQWSNTYGLSPQFLDSLGISGPLFHRVFVANLDYKVDDTKLREVFRLAGKVVRAEVTKDRDGKSRGFGVVEMDHPVEAVQAISMFNNQMLYDRRMTVRMDRESFDRGSGDSRPPKLPEGLRSIGMGLGAGGNPLHDVPRGAPSMPQSSSSRYGGSSSLSSMSSDLGYSSSMSSSGLGGGLSSLGGLSSMSSYQSMSSSDLARGGSLSSSLYGTMGSSTTLGGTNGSSSLSGMTSSTYGYSTDTASAYGLGGRSVTAPDYDRRDTYDAGYRTSSSSLGGERERQDYRDRGSTSYNDLGTRLSSLSGSTSMASSALSHQSTSHRGVSDTIVVNNLPVSCTWQDLRDKFCEVGDVLFADIRAKGTGIVRFSSERDAQRACSMLNGTRMEGRNIEVDFY